MLILAADTSGKNGSIALVRFEQTGAPKAVNRKGRKEEPQSAQRETSETLDIIPLEGGTFSAQLVPQIAALLRKHNLRKRDIDAFAVASGPGSFTGLRVGLAAVKALAEVLNRPIAAVSRLQAIAQYAKVSGEVIAALDAGRAEIYSGSYRVERAGAELISEDLLSLPEFVRAVANRPVISPDSQLAEELRQAGASVTVVPLPKADAIARLGYEQIQAGQAVSPESLDATYIRRSDAEIMKSSLPK